MATTSDPLVLCEELLSAVADAPNARAPYARLVAVAPNLLRALASEVRAHREGAEDLNAEGRTSEVRIKPLAHLEDVSAREGVA